MKLTIPEEWQQFNNKLLEFSICCFLITYPISVYWCNASVLVICFFGIFSSTILEKIEKFRSSPGLWFMMIYFVIAAVGFTYSMDKKNAFAFIERSIGFFLLPLLFGTAKLQPQFLRKFFFVFVFVTTSAALYCLFSNILFFRKNNIDFKYFFYWEYTYQHLTAFIDLHPTYFSILLLISIVILVFAFKERVLVRIFLVSFLAFFQITVGSKIGILLLFFILNCSAILFILKFKQKRLLILYFMVNLAIVTVLYNTPVVYWRFRRAFESATSVSGHNGNDYRLLHWSCATKVIRSSPLFGVGTGDALEEINQCYKVLHKDELIGYNAHNQLLETWMKSGIIGTIVTFMLLAWPYAKAVIARDYIFIFIFSIFLIVSLVESIFSVQKGIAMFCILGTLFQGPLSTAKKNILVL